MAEIILKIFNFILTSAVIFFLIAFVAILLGRRQKLPPDQRGPDFSELFIDYSGAPELQSFTARDGTQLAYRHYSAESDKVVILFHGSGYHSRYLLPLAGFISSEGLAQVYTPDLRGHGLTPKRRGDVDYINQMDDDAADLIDLIKKDNPSATLVVGGHSSGGGMAVRFAGSKYGKQADAYLLLTPFLKYNAPTTRPNSGGWASPYFGRFMGLSMLNTMGIRSLNDMKVIEFNMPEEVRDGTETLSYSFRLNTAYSPRNYKKDLSVITQPLLVVAGTADEAFIADKFESVIAQYTDAEVRLLEGLTHFGVVLNPEVRPVIRKWLEGLGKRRQVSV
jgi:non-heme chloroperoxidase